MKTTLIAIIFGLVAHSGAQNCGDITLQDCARSYCDEIVVDNIATKEDCQNVCLDAVEWFHCDSFFYNIESKKCAIYDCPVQEWEATCKIIGAPVGVDVPECLASEVGCDMFRIGQCENGTPFGEVTVPYISACKQACQIQSKCGFYKFDKEDKICTFYETAVVANCEEYFGPVDPSYKSCQEEEPDYADCYDVYLSNQTLPGIYVLKPDEETQFEAYCLEEGWTVVQSRGQFDNPPDFFLKVWQEYVEGFGDPGKEHWIGLNNIYALTNRQNKQMQLRVHLEKFTLETADAFYDNFYLEDKTLYRLRLGNFSGTGGDSLGYGNWHNGQAFSTIDNDNDESENNCAITYKGAWWYSKCHASNLNGYNYGNGEEIPYATGIVWSSFTTHYHSLKSDVMAIRPMNAI